MSKQSKATKFIVYTGIMSALSIVLIMLLEIPITPDGSLKIDLSDVPAAVAGVIMGPVAALAVEFIKVLVHLLTKGIGSTMGYGDLMNFLVGVAVAVPFSIVYRSLVKKDLKKFIPLLAAGLTGMVAMVAMGLVGNYFIAPPFFEFYMHFKLTSGALWAYIGSATILNLLKSAILAVVMIPIVRVAKKKIVA
jgi:riboflavin transporter